MGRAGNYVYKQVDRKQHKNEYLVYNLETARCYCATLPYDNPLIWYRGENGIIRLENELISVNVLGQHENWRLALPESINEIHSACYYNEIYYFSIKTRLYKIDLSTGDILWVHDAADDDRELVHRNLLGGLAVCHDRCYFFGPGTNKLYALSAETGDMVMETNPISPGVSGVCIAGDLLFALLGEEHAALDRYTGEEVWRLDDQKYNFNPIAVEGEVLLRSFAGYDLISYAWNKDNPYFSRDKPK